MAKKKHLSDLLFVESLPECKKFTDDDWEVLKDELIEFIESTETTEGGTKIDKRPIEELYNYFMDTSDISTKFATSAILFLIASATRRNQTIIYYQGQQHLNLFCMTFGQSSLMRKTVTENRIRAVLEKVQIPVIDSIFTGAAIINVLQETPKGSMLISEFSRILELFNNQYYSDLPEALSDIYDCKKQVVKWTRSKGKERVKEPYINFWTSTTVRSYELLKEELFTQGFLMRFLYTVEDKKTRFEPIHFAPQQSKIAYEVIDELLLAIRTTPVTQIRPSSTTKDWDNYNNYCNKIALQAQDDIYSVIYSYYGRTPEFALKIAGLLELARYSFLGLKPLNDIDGTPYIGLSKDTLNLAVKIVKMYEEQFRIVVKKSRTKAESEPVRTQEKEIQHVVGAIADSDIKILSRGELIKATRINPRKLDEVLDALTDTYELSYCDTPKIGKKGGRPSSMYWLTESGVTEDDAKKIYSNYHK